MCHASYERVVEDNMRPSVQKFKLNWNLIDHHENDTKHSKFANLPSKKEGYGNGQFKARLKARESLKIYFTAFKH